MTTLVKRCVLLLWELTGAGREQEWCSHAPTSGERPSAVQKLNKVSMNTAQQMHFELPFKQLNITAHGKEDLLKILASFKCGSSMNFLDIN